MNYIETRNSIIRKAAQQKVPVLGEFELSALCNLKCSMCYVVHQHKPIELTTKQWKDIFDQAVASGLLFALFTGGEIFLRPDFEELYVYLYDLGVRMTLFTNGTLINERIIDILKKRPPEFIAITLYGASNQTYELVTGIKDGFDKVNHGINLLKTNKINLVLRTIPLKIINEEIDKIINYVKTKDMMLNYFLYVGPSRDQCLSNKDARLTPGELVGFEYKIREAFPQREKETLTVSKSHASCVALKSAYFINHKGEMQACALAYMPKASIIDKDLLTTFKDLSTVLTEIESCSTCASCPVSSSCIHCYARRLTEGKYSACSSYLKEHATLRRNKKYGEV